MYDNILYYQSMCTVNLYGYTYIAHVVKPCWGKERKQVPGFVDVGFVLLTKLTAWELF